MIEHGSAYETNSLVHIAIAAFLIQDRAMEAVLGRAAESFVKVLPIAVLNLRIGLCGGYAPLTHPPSSVTLQRTAIVWIQQKYAFAYLGIRFGWSAQ